VVLLNKPIETIHPNVGLDKLGALIVVIEEALPCVLMVCQVEWPDFIKAAIISESNPVLLAWLVVQCICNITPGTLVAISVVQIKKRKVNPLSPPKILF
jgi:hypothetical protein